jgi:hypothetical protein
MTVSVQKPTDQELTEAVEAARTLLRSLAPRLDQLADQVWCFGVTTTTERRRALGMVAQMAAELILGAESMFDARRTYAGSSLVRQLIETDYLLFLFGQDPIEAERWLTGTPEQHKSMFQPGAMRKRSGTRFDVDEYSRHCEMGGHPRPAARALVDRHHLSSRDVAPVLWLDLAGHAARIWDHYKAAVAVCSPTNVYPDRFAAIDADVKRWWDASRAVRHALLGLGIAAEEPAT